ncbi:TBC domain protein, putative [Perkinsus marinus ATCC 50983]|uniref:TBC domain protein, putative n=1 Tax=Perkinsus marinus (strain ATCC 50983 / TXsc) TaxID=423536 RepID=C5L105_PERM5|nr:TBC domain protein, putative [Perkinsus marinus ATCC 50983]EER09647.1 TBC domain protein, putative [Perkinsus marinus ATCC 50983]|eukprot:XP_002777852.1 TBC domain protein, putative [Perkinsus marinus ATCC 50983]
MLTRSGAGSLGFPSDSEVSGKLPSSGSNPARISKLRHATMRDQVDLDELNRLLWSGCPFDSDFDVRVRAWELALGYVPPRKERQNSAVERKRREYRVLTREFADVFALSTDDLQPVSATAAQQQQYASLRQIRVDIPRTFSELNIFASERIQRMMERILYIWAVRNPASGYVQGINDLLTPFIVILLQAKLDLPIKDIDVDDENRLDDVQLMEVEADAYWMLSRVLSDIQDHYTFGQPGIQRLILMLKDIVKRVDDKLADHLEDEMIDYLQIAFRWFNCLMLRELPLQCTLRLWDTCIAESDGFSTYMVYICAAFLVHWGPQLEGMDFSGIMLFFQKAPTSQWTEADIETLLAEAFVLKSLFDNAPSHLRNQDFVGNGT